LKLLENPREIYKYLWDDFLLEWLLNGANGSSPSQVISSVVWSSDRRGW